MKLLLIALCLCAPLAVQAAEVGGCSDLKESIDKRMVKKFSNGKIVASLADTEEPAAAAMHLLVEIEAGGKKSCFALHEKNYAEGGGHGFRSLNFNKLVAKHDPNKGLSLRIPFEKNINGEDSEFGFATIRINLQTKKVVLESEEKEPNLFREGGTVLVTGKGCQAKGGKISEDKRYTVCLGGFYDGYIVGDPENIILTTDEADDKDSKQ